jgi:hypothetical protein
MEADQALASNVKAPVSMPLKVRVTVVSVVRAMQVSSRVLVPRVTSTWMAMLKVGICNVTGGGPGGQTMVTVKLPDGAPAGAKMRPVVCPGALAWAPVVVPTPVDVAALFDAPDDEAAPVEPALDPPPPVQPASVMARQRKGHSVMGDERCVIWSLVIGKSYQPSAISPQFPETHNSPFTT